MEKWIIGPQAIGVVFLILGLIFYRFPPKRINSFYGYRTPSSMKNQETWDDANRFFTCYMIKSGLVLILIGIALILLFKTCVIPVKIKQLLTIFLFMTAGMGVAVVGIVATEKHLSKTFDKK